MEDYKKWRGFGVQHKTEGIKYYQIYYSAHVIMIKQKVTLI